MANRLYYSIKEVSEMLKTPISRIRFWEKDFPFTIPKKSEKGTRYYTEKEIQNIQLLIHLLDDRKLTIEGAKLVIKNQKGEAEKRQKIVQKLRKIKEEIHTLRKTFETQMDLSTEENELEETTPETNDNNV